MEKFFLILLFTFNTTEECNLIQDQFNSQSNELIEKLQLLEDCAKPVSPFLDKVYSNIKYRANRLKVCVGLVKNGNNGFDCSRELRKMRRSRDEDECAGEFELVEKYFKEFETAIKEFQSCQR
jgi:hypothetical protein